MDLHGFGYLATSDSLDYVIDVLESLLVTEITDLRTKVLYTLGFIHFFDRADTLSARVFIEELFETAPRSAYATFAKRFFDNNQFVKISRLPSLVEFDLAREAEEAETAAREAEEADRALLESEQIEQHDIEPEEMIDDFDEDIDLQIDLEYYLELDD